MKEYIIRPGLVKYISLSTLFSNSIIMSLGLPCSRSFQKLSFSLFHAFICFARSKELPAILLSRYAVSIWFFRDRAYGFDISDLCYQIIVLENGKVVEQGPHEILLSKAGRYAQLWGQQNNAPDGVDLAVKV